MGRADIFTQFDIESLEDGLGLRAGGEDPDPIGLMTTAFNWPWAPYQLTLLKLLINLDWRRLILLAPPRHRKTTIVAGFMAIFLGEDPSRRIMVVSHTRDYSALLMNQVEAIMKMPLFKRYYGDLIPKSGKSRWTTYERHIARRPVWIKDPSMIALSPDSGTPGYGADLIIADDLVTQANSSSPTRRRNVERWFDGSLLKRLEPDGHILVVGARFYKEDLYGTLIKRGGWKQHILKSSPKEPLWPWRWSGAAIKEKQLEDPVFFPAQYQQNPREIDSGILDPAWFSHYINIPEHIAIFAGIDPIVKIAGSKFSYCVVGRDANGTVYLLDHYSAHHDDQDQPGLLDLMYERWRPAVAAYESNGPQESAMRFIHKAMKHPLNIIPVPSLVSKYLRLSSIAGHVRTGRVLVPGEWDVTGSELKPSKLAEAITTAWGQFPAGDLDLLDSFEKAVTVALSGPPPAFGSQSAIDLEALRRKLGTEESIKKPRNLNDYFPIKAPAYGRVFREAAHVLTPGD